MGSLHLESPNSESWICSSRHGQPSHEHPRSRSAASAVARVVVSSVAMSHVDTIIITHSSGEDCCDRGEGRPDIVFVETHINAKLHAVHSASGFATPPQLFQEAEYRRGYKPNTPIWFAAINYCDWKVLLDAIDSAPWQSRELVQIMICCENDDDFSVYRIADMKKLREIYTREVVDDDDD
jgi:hypothetical protein